MKRIISLVLTLTLYTSMYAQKDVTKFLGIPVDGTKSEMIQKLKAKGFTYNSVKDMLEGEFNGSEVQIAVVTNRNKVYRIYVADKYPRDETEIKIRFNKLCHQFENNDKYSGSKNQTISDDEDISYEILVNKKRYEAAFFQKTDEKLKEDFVKSRLLSEYTTEQLADTSKVTQSLISTSKLIFELEFLEKKKSKLVWFMINQEYGQYRILMFYDNENNKSAGEDL